MTDRAVTIKMPEDEVDAIDNEADNEGKNRSEYLREIIRSRNIDVEEKLDEQVLTKADKQALEERIAELQRERDKLQQEINAVAQQKEHLKQSIDMVVESAVEELRDEYDNRIEELRVEKAQAHETLQSLTDNEDINLATSEHLNNHHGRVEEAIAESEDEIEEYIQRKKQRVIQMQARKIDNTYDEIQEDLEEVKQQRRHPLTRLGLWIRSKLSRSDNSNTA
jgi:chromosome segregation protein